MVKIHNIQIPSLIPAFTVAYVVERVKV